MLCPRDAPQGYGDSRPQIPREELLCQDAEKAGTARLVCGSQASRALLPTGTRSPLLCTPCHWMSWALRGSRLSSTWSWLRHLPEGCQDGGGASGSIPGEHGGHYHQGKLPGPSTNPLKVLSPSQMPLRKLKNVFLLYFLNGKRQNATSCHSLLF